MKIHLRLIFVVALIVSCLSLAAPASAASVDCDADPSGSDIQAVIDAAPAGSVIQLMACAYVVTAPIALKDSDSLLGTSTSGVPASRVLGSGQTVDCIGSEDAGGGTANEATGVTIETVDVSGCDHGIDTADGWLVGADGAGTVYTHLNNIGIYLGSIDDGHADIRIADVRTFDNDHMGIRGHFEDTAAYPRAQVADSSIYNNGVGGLECTGRVQNSDNCAGTKFLGGNADSANGGVSPLICNNEIYNNHGGYVNWGHGLWIDVTGDGVPAGDGLLVAGNYIHNNDKQGVRIERSDGHRIGATGTVDCDGTIIDASNVIDANGTGIGSCVAIRQAENNVVEDNECNVNQDSADGGRVVEIAWNPRADDDLDHDGDIQCAPSDTDDCQRTIGNVVRDNTIHLVGSGESIPQTFVGFNAQVADPYPGMWASNDYYGNDYCMSTARPRQKHFRWVNFDGSGKVNQPWDAVGPGNDWRDPPAPQYDEDTNASFDATCDNRS
jgi:hypothetical protein